jgi:cell wall-associated NlpC family hydrolase
MLDGATELRQGVWGMRFGVGLDASGTALAPLAAGGEPSGVWNSDLDAGLNVGRIPYVGTLFGAADPAAFMGAGVAGVSSTEPTTGERSSSLVPTWSYGARAGLPFASWLRLEVEARHRSTVGTVSPEAYPASQGWEYRAGLALRFGGAASARTVSAPRGEAAERRTSVGSGDVARGASAAEVADRTVLTAQRYIGTPYRWGGTSPRQGFDCSGFVQYVYREQGIELPRVARDQARAGQRLPTRLDGLATGDLLFFARGGPTVDHVAIYAGDGRIVHSSSSGRGVRYDELTGDRGRWYVQHLVAVRRVIPEDGVTPGALPAGETTPMPRRELPLDEAFEAITSERGDAAPPPSR